MKKALIGYGGHAREVMSQIGIKLKCFVDDKYVCKNTFPISEFDPNEYAVMIAIANPIDRYNIVQRLPKETKFFTWVHPNAHIFSDDVEIGEGSFIGVNSVLTSNIKIGKHCLLNRANHVGHDCVIGDYFSAMPGSIVSGNVTIGDLVYLGTNSSIREKLSIVNNVTIGLNTGIVKSINESGTYVGQKTKKL